MGRACSPASYQSNQTLLADRPAAASVVAWAGDDGWGQRGGRVDAGRRRGCSEVDLEVHVAAGRVAALALGAQRIPRHHLLPHQNVERPLSHVAVTSEAMATVQLRLDVDVAPEGPS